MYYKIRKQGGKKPSSYSITVPPEVGRLLAHRDLTYEFRLTNEGLLYKPMPKNEEEFSGLPDWAMEP